METSSHVYLNGISMSKRKNFVHYKNGYVVGETYINNSFNDRDKLVDSDLDIRDCIPDNVNCIEPNQDGFRLMCDSQIDSNFSLDITSSLNESNDDVDSHVDFPGSPGSSKIELFTSIEALVPSLDENLEEFLLSDFSKLNNKNCSNDNAHSKDQRSDITDIAETFNLDDLIPSNFDVTKDLSDSVVVSDLVNDCENVVEISLVDFDKCDGVKSTDSLTLTEPLNTEPNDYVLNDVEIIPSSVETTPELDSAKSSVPVNDQEQIYISSKDCKFKVQNNSLVLSDDQVTCELTFGNIIKNEKPDNTTQSSCTVVQSTPHPKPKTSQSIIVSDPTTNMVQDIPTMKIVEAEPVSSPESVFNSSTGTVLITCDKVTKKMQIVLTLDEGQQIYDIETSGIDSEDQALGIELPNTLNLNGSSGIELTDVNASELEQFTAQLEAEKVMELMNGKDGSTLVTGFLDFLEGPSSRKRKVKTFVCEDEGCGQVFDKESKLRVHLLSHKNSSRPFKCQFEGCDWAFTTPYRLRRHSETHYGFKDYTCTVEGCNRKFTTVYNLKTHVKRHKWEDSLVCPSKKCQMRFSSRRRLELHLRVHDDVEAPYKCSICSKQYYSANCIASHIRTHQYNEDDFKCPFQGCGKIYDKVCRLRQHIRHHTGDRPYTCPAPDCHWSFMSASKLTRHMRKHTGERKFTCTEPGCGKSFMRPEHLKGHIVIHSGDRPFHCPHENCDAKFTAKSSLYVHLKKHTPGILKVVYRCPSSSCDKKYNTKSALKQHLLKHHPLPLGDVKDYCATNVGISVSPTDMDLEDNLMEDVDDPSSVQMSVAVDPGSINLTPSVFSGTVESIQETSEKRNNKSVPKMKKSSKVTPKISDKLVKESHSGCARTDYCCKKKDSPMSFISYNHNSMDDQNFLSNGHANTEINYSDVMLTSSILYPADHADNLLLRSSSNTFLQEEEECSSPHSIYHDDSILVEGSMFDTDMILMSDDVGSDESVLNHSAGDVFCEQNEVDVFGESIAMHSL